MSALFRWLLTCIQQTDKYGKRGPASLKNGPWDASLFFFFLKGVELKTAFSLKLKSPSPSKIQTVLNHKTGVTQVVFAQAACSALVTKPQSASPAGAIHLDLSELSSRPLVRTKHPDSGALERWWPWAAYE